jgi:hypothetical protein
VRSARRHPLRTLDDYGTLTAASVAQGSFRNAGPTEGTVSLTSGRAVIGVPLRPETWLQLRGRIFTSALPNARPHILLRVNDDRPPICPRCGVTMVPAALSAAEGRDGDWACLECEELGEDE